MHKPNMIDECGFCVVYAMSNVPMQPPCGGLGYDFLDASSLGIPSDFEFDRAWEFDLVPPGAEVRDEIVHGPEYPAEYSDWRGSVDDTDNIYTCSDCLPGNSYTEFSQNARVSQSEAETTVGLTEHCVAGCEYNAATAAKLCPLPSDPNYGDVAIYEAWLRSTGRTPDDCGKELWDGSIVDGAACVRPVCLDRRSVVATDPPGDDNDDSDGWANGDGGGETNDADDNKLPRGVPLGSAFNPAQCCLCEDDNDITTMGTCNSATADGIAFFIMEHVKGQYKDIYREYLTWLFVIIPAHYVSLDLLKALFGRDSSLAKGSAYGIVCCSVCIVGIVGALLGALGQMQLDYEEDHPYDANCSNGYDPGAGGSDAAHEMAETMNSFGSFMVTFGKSQLLWLYGQLKENFNPVLTGSIKVPFLGSWHFGAWNEERNEILGLLHDAFGASTPVETAENPLAGQVIQPQQPLAAPH